jgi:glutathione S-transferase
VIHDADGFRLAESIAIYHYLGRRGYFKERWYPKGDVKKLSQIDEFLQWNHNSLLFSTGTMFLEAWIKPIRDTDSLEHGMMQNVRQPLNYVDINISLDLLENTWLKKSKYIVGEEPTFAELIASCAIMQVIGLRLLKLDEDKYPLVKKWLDDTREFFNPEFDDVHKFVYKYGEKFNGKSPFEF